MDKFESSLYQGEVIHRRLKPTNHQFRYRVFSLCVDLDELPTLNRLRWFSVNRFNLFSLYEKDHSAGQPSLAEGVRQQLEKCGFASATHKIRLLCYPRILGYVFNPLSVYFCYNSGGELEVILYEVNNTFGSRHTYVLPVEAGSGQVSHGCSKLFYVSPFMPMNSAYQFRIQPPAGEVAVRIYQTELADIKQAENKTENQAVFYAAFSGKKHSLTNSSLLGVFFKYPLMTLKVIGAIHWEALKLWRKKLSIQPRNKGRNQSISWHDNNGEIHYENL